VVGTGATLHAEYAVGVERVATTFTGTTVPDGTLDTTLKDAFRTTNPLTGDFASGNWTFSFVVRAVTSASSQNGRIRCRLIKADADGSNATEITAAQQQGSLVGAMSSTTTDYTSTVTFNPGVVTLSNQYLFIQIAWERTTAGGMTSADVNWRTGSSASLGTRIATTDFVPGNQAVTVAPIGTITGIMDSYSSTNQSTSMSLSTVGAGVAQSVVGNGSFVNDVTFFIAKTLPTVSATIVAKVWATTGSHGTTAVPSGTALATSDSRDVNTFESGYTAQGFVFTGANRIQLSLGVTYAIGVELTAQSSGGANVASDNTSPTHAGNAATSSWIAQAGSDLCFILATRSGAELLAPTVASAAPVVQGACIDPRLVDGHSLQYRDNWLTINLAAISAQAQSFVGDGRTLAACRFVSANAGGSTGTVVAKVYATTGTHGTNAKPTGAALATSVNVDVATLPTYPTTAWTEFAFSGANQITLTASTVYAAVIEVTALTGPNVQVGSDQTMRDVGNIAQYQSPTWFAAASSNDVVFEVATAVPPDVFAPTVEQVLAVAPSAIAAGSVVTAPTITPGAVSLTSATVSVVSQLFAPEVTGAAEQTVMGTTIAAAASVAVPTLASQLTSAFLDTIDSYGLAYFTSDYFVGPTTTGVAQSILGTGRVVSGCQFSFNREPDTTGTLTARIYAITGTHGSNAKPTGPALVSSDPLDVTTIVPNDVAMTSFVFSGANRMVLTTGVAYAVAVEISSFSGTSCNPRTDTGTVVHPGNLAAYWDEWSSATGMDLIFSVLSETATVFAPSVSLVAGDQTIAGATLSSTSVLSAPTVTAGAVTLISGTIALASMTAAPAVTTGPVTVLSAFCAAGSLVTVPSVATGAVTIAGAAISASGALTTPTIFTLTFATGAHVASTAQLSTPSLALTVQSATRASTLTVTPPTVAVRVTTATLSTSAQVFIPSVTPGAIVIAGAQVPSGSTLTVPSVSVGATTIALQTLAATSTLLVPTVTEEGGISAAHLASGTLMHPPTVVPAAITVLGTVITAGSSVLAPMVAPGALTVMGASVPAGSTLTVPSVSVGVAGIALVALASTTTLTAPTVTEEGGVSAAHLASTVMLTAPTVAPEGALIGSHLASAVLLYSPLVVPGAVTVLAATVGTAVTLTAPTLTPGAVTIVAARVPSGSTMQGPAVLTEGPQTVVGAALSAASLVFPPMIGRPMTRTTPVWRIVSVARGVHVGTRV
jgi:hypothetical protein